MASDKMTLERIETLEKLPGDGEPDLLRKTQTLGSVRLHNIVTNERVLVPQPSSDPNDPLNWSVKVKKCHAF